MAHLDYRFFPRAGLPVLRHRPIRVRDRRIHKVGLPLSCTSSYHLLDTSTPRLAHMLVPPRYIPSTNDQSCTPSQQGIPSRFQAFVLDTLREASEEARLDRIYLWEYLANQQELDGLEAKVFYQRINI